LQKEQTASDMPQPWQSQRNYENLAEQFAEALTAVHGECFRADDLDQALLRLGRLLYEIEAEQVVVNDEPPLSEQDFAALWPDIAWHVVDRSEGDLRETCNRADAGLSSADAALAETGSLVLSSGPGKSRLATLLPPVHIALVPTSRLTPDLFTWTGTRTDHIPANLTLVSGPSKTADIEQTMAIGVHGPERFIVILYDDAAAE
jgi:L-lactate dehydrogenase complex protein LldG